MAIARRGMLFVLIPYSVRDRLARTPRASIRRTVAHPGLAERDETTTYGPCRCHDPWAVYGIRSSYATDPPTQTKVTMSKIAATTDTPFLSAYDRRVMLVRDQITGHSTLDEKTAAIIAVHVLHALDTLPGASAETIRSGQPSSTQ
jgi:hypothetical protein